MRFYNPKTGEVYDVQGPDTGDCSQSGFCKGITCTECKLFNIVGYKACSTWVINHPQQAAELMGYQLLDQAPPVCPVISQPCTEGKCGWWNKTKNQCSIMALADHVLGSGATSPAQPAQPVENASGETQDSDLDLDAEIERWKAQWKPCEQCGWCASCDHSIIPEEQYPCRDCKDRSKFVARNYCPTCGRPQYSKTWADLIERVRRIK